MTKEFEQILIHESDRLLRRIQFLDPNFIKPDGTPSSASFSLRKGENGLSVDLERLTTYEKSITDRFKFRLFSIEASETKSMGLDNQHDPQLENYAHTLIIGNFSRSISRKLASMAKRINYS